VSGLGGWAPVVALKAWAVPAKRAGNLFGQTPPCAHSPLAALIRLQRKSIEVPVINHAICAIAAKKQLSDIYDPRRRNKSICHFRTSSVIPSPMGICFFVLVEAQLVSTR
jgi:hypothetical protein